MRRIISFILSIILIISGIACAREIPISGVNITEDNFIAPYECSSYCLYEIKSKQILTSKEAEKRLPLASVTKIMTLLLIFEAIDSGEINKNDIVTISENASSMGGSQVYLEPGEEQKVDDLLKCIIISSANDACVAMAEKISGSELSFVNSMNNKASQLGMLNTHFVNCCGLDVENHYSCAKDIAIMSGELLIKYPDIKSYTLKWMDEIIHNTKRGSKAFGLTNTNKLINAYDGLTGLKTGFTSKAGFCVSSSAERNNTHYVAVIMGAKSSKERFAIARSLLDYGFSNNHVITIDCNLINKKVKIPKSINKYYDVSIKNKINILVDTSINLADLNYKYNIDCKNIINSNKSVGKVIINIPDGTSYSYDLYLSDELVRTSVFYYFNKLLFG